MTPETKAKYQKAVMELFSTLSHDQFKPINVDDFCQRHDLRPSFFLALRELDALEYDAAHDRGYKQTPTLAKLDPEQIVGRMRGLGGKKSLEKVKPDVIVYPGTSIPEGLALNTDVVDDPGTELIESTAVVTDLLATQDTDGLAECPTEEQRELEELGKEIESTIASQGDSVADSGPADEPMPTAPVKNPYEVRIRRSGFKLRMDVNDTEDMALLTSIVYALSVTE